MDTLMHMADEGATDPNDNSTVDREGFKRKIVTLGGMEGQGSNARPALAHAVVEAAYQRAISLNPPKIKGQMDDATMIHDRYSKAVALKRNLGYVKMPSEKQQISKLRALMKVGLLPQVNGVEVMQRTRDVIDKMVAANAGKPLSMSPFDCYVQVARRQVEISPDSAFSDEQIQAALMKDTPDDPTEADQLDKIAGALDKLRGDDEGKGKASPETVEIAENMIEELRARIETLGGTTAKQKDDARRREKAAKLQAQAAALVDARR